MMQGPTESSLSYANRFADLAAAAKVDDMVAKNALVLGLNDVTSRALDGELRIQLKLQGYGTEYLQASTQDIWDLAQYEEVLDVLRKGKIVPTRSV